MNPRRDLSTISVTRFCVECQGCKTVVAPTNLGFPSGRRPCVCTNFHGKTTWQEPLTLLQLATELEHAKADQKAFQQSVLDDKQAATDAEEVAAEVAAALAKRIEARKTATIGFLQKK